MIKKVLISSFFILGFMSLPILAEEVDPSNIDTEEVVEETNVNENENSEEPTLPEEKEPTPPAEEDPEPEEPLNGWQNNNTQYYQDGVAVDGVKTIDGNVYYFKDAVLNQYTGFVKNNEQNNWVFVRNGKSDWSFTGVAKSIANNEWYHAKNGILDWNFTGFSQSVENGKWYVSHKGKLNWNYTGVAKSIANNEWYHAKNGRLDWGFTGFSKSYLTNKWYVSYKGKLNWKYTGVAKSIANNQWYHAKNGRLDWGFTGLSKSYLNNKYYYSRNGKLDWNYIGRIKEGKYVSKGRLITNPVLIKAAELLWEANGYKNTGWTLRAGYNWVLKNLKFSKLNTNSNEENVKRGAAVCFYEALKHKGGVCYNINSVIYEMARAMGYEVRMMFGTNSAGDRSTEHSWVEIIENGEVSILDPDLEIALGVNGWKTKDYRTKVRGRFLTYNHAKPMPE